MSEARISSTAIIAPEAQLGDGVIVGHFSVVFEDVVVEDGTSIGIGAILFPGVRIGKNAVIQDYAVLGKRVRQSNIKTWTAQQDIETLIDDRVTIGTRAIVFAGCHLGAGSFIGDGAYLRENCVVGEDSVVGSNARLEFAVAIGRKCLIFSGAYLSEHTRLEDQVFIGAAVCTAAAPIINFQRAIPGEISSPIFRRGCRVGTGAVIHPRVVVGREAVVAAGAVVFDSVPDATVVLGNPARPVKRVPPEQFLDASDRSGQDGSDATTR